MQRSPSARLQAYAKRDSSVRKQWVGQRPPSHKMVLRDQDVLLTYDITHLDTDGQRGISEQTTPARAQNRQHQKTAISLDTQGVSALFPLPR